MSAWWPSGQICHQLTLTKIHFYLRRFEVMKFNLTCEDRTTNFQPFQVCVSTASFCALFLQVEGLCSLINLVLFLKWQCFTQMLFFTSLTLQGVIYLPYKRNIFMITADIQSLLQRMNSFIHLINILVEDLLCARHCFRAYSCSDNTERVFGTYILLRAKDEKSLSKRWHFWEIWKDLGEEFSRQLGHQMPASGSGNKLGWLEKQKVSIAKRIRAQR